MKNFLISIPSLGRPCGLITSIMAAWRMKSGQSNVKFVTYLEQHDWDNEKILNIMAGSREDVPTCRVVRGQPQTLGGKWNAILKYIPEGSYDYISLFGDKCITTSSCWDSRLLKRHEMYPHRPVWWRGDGHGANIVPSVPRSFIEAACETGANLVPDIFPFWFVDTWIQDIDIIIWGIPRIVGDAELFYAAGPTIGGRDHKFWVQTYIDMESERVSTAQRMMKILKAPERNVQMTVNNLRKQMLDLLDRASYFEEMANKEPPSQSYLEAKEKAMGLTAHTHI